MHQKGCSPEKDSSAEMAKESRIPNAPASAISSKSPSLRQCKSFNMQKDSMLPKPPSSREISSRAAKSNGSSSRTEAPAAASFENGAGRASKPNGGSKSGDPAATQAVAKQKQVDNGKLDPKAESFPPNSRSESVTTPRNGGILKSSSSNKLNASIRQASVKPAPAIEGASKVTRTKDSTPPSGLADVKSLSSSLNADPQKKLPPIRTSRPSASRKNAMSKNSANLCAECKAELEGAVCFIGNDGRVSACTSRTAVRLCKNLKCANNNPEHVASVVAAAVSAPKKYLVSRRHSLPQTGSRSSKGGSDKEHAPVSNQNGTAPPCGGDAGGSIPQSNAREQEELGEELDMQGELEDDVISLEDMVGEVNGVASTSPHRGRPGFRQMRTRSFSVIEKQGQEVVTLKKQMMQERRQAEEWMLDYAIEEAWHRLAPSKDSKVKALVEAFESVILPQKDAGGTTPDQNHGPGPF